MDEVVSVEAPGAEPRKLQRGRRAKHGRGLGGAIPARTEKVGLLRRGSFHGGTDGLSESAPSWTRSVVWAEPNVEQILDQAEDISSLLPSLKGAARQLIPNDRAADHLVELTLARAAAILPLRSEEQRLKVWLKTLLEDTFGRVGPDLQRLYSPQSR